MEATENLMSPDQSPGSVRPGVRRVNNVPLMIVGGVAIAFIVVMMIVAADRAEKQNAPVEAAPEVVSDSSASAREVIGKYAGSGGMIEPALASATAEEAGKANAATELPAKMTVARPDDLELPPPPPAGSSAGPNGTYAQRDQEAERIKQAKIQMLEDAIKSKTGVPFSAARSSGSSMGTTSSAPQSRDEMLSRIADVRQKIQQVQVQDPTAAYQARLAQIRGITGSAGGFGGSDDDASELLADSSAKSGYGQFDSPGGDRWKLDAKMEAPRSPYELRAGFVVPATLISGINSDLPGQIMAQVAQNVYDTPTGNHLLIPLGSRLVGSYSSEVAYGQSRVLVAWQRIIFPDGKALDIGSMPGGDSAGYSGFKDRVNNHYLRLFGSAFLMSAVTAGITLSQDEGDSFNQSDSQRASDAMSEALGQQLGQVTAQLIAKNMNIAPTIEVRPGYRFNVIVTKDMTFSKPYESFDY